MSQDDAGAPQAPRAPAERVGADAAAPPRGSRSPRQPAAPAQARRDPTADSGAASAPVRRWGWIDAIGPAAVSAVAHLVVLLALAMLLIARDSKPEPVMILSGPAEDEAEASEPVEFDAQVSPPEETEQAEMAPAEMPTADVETLVPEPIPLDSVAASEAAPAVEATGSLPAEADVMAAIGGGGENAAGSGRGGGGGPSGRGSAAPSFFGKTGKGRSVCFVCDNSNSYREGGFHMVLAEVARAVDALKPDQSFFVVFCSDAAYPMFHPDKLDELQPATPQNKQRLQAWLATVEMCAGGQGIGEAVKLATGLGADVVYFLSDGEHSASVVRRVVAADFGDTVVHTFGMQQNVVDRRTGMLDPKKAGEQQARNQTLIDIAAAHGGEFTPVQVPPEAAALEQARPIRKNRSRGAVWGTRLDATQAN